jgi:TatD DNase family protein
MHDSHIHLALEPLNSNLDQVIQEFIDTGGKYILTQGTDILDFDDTIKFAKKYPGIIQVALGLHPSFFEEVTFCKEITTNLDKVCEKYITQFKELFDKNISDLSAIGETGLDYYQYTLNKSMNEGDREKIKEIQIDSFKTHLKLAKENNLPLSIHARDENGKQQCVKDVINIVAKEGRGQLKGCFHSYTGGLESVEDILNLGFHIGFNAIITYKSGENVREILKKVPLARILFETDGPFLPPQSIRKNKKIKEKYAKPSHVREIMETAALIKNISVGELEAVTDSNYEKLFLNL